MLWHPVLRWRKYVDYFKIEQMLSTNRLGPMISPGLPLLATQYDKNLDVISTYLVGLFLLWTGVFTFFTSAAASVWGKRMVFVLSAAALLAFNAWGFFVKVRSHIFYHP